MKPSASPSLSLPLLRARREYDPNDPNPCRGCSDCCEYIAIPISRPRTRRDFDELLWFLLHQNVYLFVDDENDWYVQFNTPCTALVEQRCGVYRQRPRICHEYKVDECTTYSDGPAEKLLFTSPDELLAYVRTKRPKTFRHLSELYPDGFPSVAPDQQVGIVRQNTNPSGRPPKSCSGT